MNGRFPAKLDDKNRLIVPAKLRPELGGTFYVTIGVSRSYRHLTIYTEESWGRLTEKYDQLSIAQKSGAAKLLFIYAAECIPDKQARFTLTQSLMTYAGISRDVIIAGNAGQAEIWDMDTFQAFELESLTPENIMASMEAIAL